MQVQKKATLTGHKDCIYALEKGLQENIFYTAAGDGMVVAWDLQQPELGKLLAQVSNSVYALHLLADQQILIIGQNFEGLHFIDLNIGKEIYSLNLGASAIFDITSTNENIIVALGDGTVVFINKKDFLITSRLKLSDKSARTLAYNSRTKELAVGYSDNHIRIISLTDFRLLWQYEAHKNSIFTLRFSPDNLYLLSGSRDAHLKVWDIGEAYQLKESVVAHMYTINHICYSPDHQYFATCSMDKSIKIWDARSYKLLKVIDKARYAGHGTSVNKILWSEREGEIISCSDDRTVSVWDIQFNYNNSLL